MSALTAPPSAEPLPADHPLRHELNDEVHARPPQALRAPLHLTYLALFSDAAQRPAEHRAVAALATRHGVAPPAPGANHFSADLGPFRLKWERHSEFSRYKLIVDGAGEAPFDGPAYPEAARELVEAVPGQLLVATRVALLPAWMVEATGAPGLVDAEALAARWFGGNVLVGGPIAGGAATALTDFRIHDDGLGRLLVLDRGMSPRQAGRMVQRLLEIDSYRMLALLALPVAQALGPFLAGGEHELAEVVDALRGAGPTVEPLLLERLTRLEAEIERRQVADQYRFGAAAAYHQLVQRRIGELREGEPLPGIQSFREFTERRLVPAMSTCTSAAARLDGLSERVARATQLLSTRIEVTREQQNQALLASMNARAEMQLNLQSTVEGLSVAAVSYYVVGLISYLAKGLHELGLHLDPAVVTAASIPVVALLVALGVRRIRRLVHKPPG